MIQFRLYESLHSIRCAPFRTFIIKPILLILFETYSIRFEAFSRVRSLSELRPIGLTSSIRELIDLGPPVGFLTQVLRIFEEKMARTQKDVEDVLAELGWKS